jgi:MFS family permease
MPVRQSFVVEIVGRGDIGNAILLNSAMFNSARVVGPAIAGLTIGAFGPATAFAINAVSYLAVLAALGAMRESELRTPEGIVRPHNRGEVMAQLREGLAYVRRTPPVLLAIVVLGLVATVGMNFQVAIPVVAREILDSDASGFGFLMAASGLGSLTAAIWLAVAGGLPRHNRLIAGALLLGAGELVLSISNLFPVSLVLMFLIGAGGIAMAATANTMIQLNVPDALRGRVMSVFTTVFAGSSPIGGLFIGTVASAAGIAFAIALGGGLAVLVALGALLWVRRQPGFVAVPPALPRERGHGGQANVERVEGAGLADAVAGSGPRPR